jgi:hypothetical protein
MPKLKLIAASIASLTVVALTPLNAFAGSPTCRACFLGCLESYSGDEYLLSQCTANCLDSDGTFCQADL